MRPVLRAAVLLVVLATPRTSSAQSQGTDPLTPEALAAVLRFFDYDESVPLHAEIVASDEALGFVREKVVFTGADGERVPSFLSLPRGDGPFPLVLLMHAGSSAKDAWWSDSSYERGADLTRSLLESGFAVFALDAQNHGERTSHLDYVPLPTLYFDNGWWASFRRMVVETTTDYRRALDYLRGRRELDLSAVATIGQSMGALTSYYLSAVEPVVSVVAAGAPALSPDWLYPLTPLNLVGALENKSVLLLAASNDVLIPSEWMEKFFELLTGGDDSLQTLESGHQLVDEYKPLMLEWVKRRLR